MSEEGKSFAGRAADCWSAMRANPDRSMHLTSIIAGVLLFIGGLSGAAPSPLHAHTQKRAGCRAHGRERGVAQHASRGAEAAASRPFASRQPHSRCSSSEHARPNTRGRPPLRCAAGLINLLNPLGMVLSVYNIIFAGLILTSELKALPVFKTLNKRSASPSYWPCGEQRLLTPPSVVRVDLYFHILSVPRGKAGFYVFVGILAFLGTHDWSISRNF